MHSSRERVGSKNVIWAQKEHIQPSKGSEDRYLLSRHCIALTYIQITPVQGSM